MNHRNHLALATSVDDSGLETLAPLQEELLKLRKRCRARDLALASMATAVTSLRRANRALTDENVLLRQQMAELGDRGGRNG